MSYHPGTTRSWVQRIAPVFAIAFTTLLLACGESGTAAPTGTDLGNRQTASASIGSGASQTDAIDALVAAAMATWTAKDAAAYAALYAEDVTVINPVGAIQVGREAFRQAHVFLFGGPFAGSTQTIAVRDVRFLTGTIAIVDQDVALTGYAFLPPNGLRATSPGVVRTTVRWVVMKRGGNWEIVAQQLTPIPPAP